MITSKIKIALTTNLCAHYNVGIFEKLSGHYDVDFYFYSAGKEWYWQQKHGVSAGDFNFEYLSGFNIGHTRVTLDLPLKLFRHQYDVYIKCINGRFALPVTYLVARLKNKPFILWTGIWMRLQTPTHRLMFPFTRYIYRHADAIVVYGEHVKHYLVSEGVMRERIFVAPHAVDNNFYSQLVSTEEQNILKEQLGIKPNQKIILYLGRMEESKGLTYLIQAFSQVKDQNSILVLAGEGSLYSELEQQARSLRIQDRIRFAGYVPTNQSVTYYSLAWVFVLPSITLTTGKEPWGLVVNEAMNQGLPVIASDAVGAAAGGLIRHLINGLIVPEKDIAALSESLSLILKDEDLRNTMGRNARQMISNWDYDHNVEGYYQAIEFVRAIKPLK
ncbi:MAG: glycosyltransferase family 4 protein [Anaerolineaceae bacterium]|nr:glycosyltransferase family 4 protein [Anaerolineaceae bacterium]